ncbi:hypothetical protein NW851_03925 [Synechococcus sp. H55.7]|uniref:hypothetical protein n=1 Tax=unclassified Synechococcus TaxID=2626047 RepID=UPI0039C1EB95
MYSLLLTYGLNPLTGWKLLVKSPEQASLWTLARQLWSRPGSRRRRPRLQISLGRLVPEQTERLSKLEVLLRLRFFIALEAETPDQPLPALPSGQGSAIQLAHYTEGSQQYKTEIIRFALGGSRTLTARRRRRRRF